MNRRQFLRMMAGAAAMAAGSRLLPTARSNVSIPHQRRAPIVAKMTHLEIYDARREEWCSLDGMVELVEEKAPDVDSEWKEVYLFPEHVNCLCTYVIPPDEAENLRNGKWLIDGEWV